MKQAIIISVILSIVRLSDVSAQLIPENYDTLSLSHELIVRGNIDYYGTSIQNDMISKFIRGGQITEENKDNSFGRHKAINRLGGIGEGECAVAHVNAAAARCRVARDGGIGDDEVAVVFEAATVE